MSRVKTSMGILTALRSTGTTSRADGPISSRRHSRVPTRTSRPVRRTAPASRGRQNPDAGRIARAPTLTATGPRKMTTKRTRIIASSESRVLGWGRVMGQKGCASALFFPPFFPLGVGGVLCFNFQQSRWFWGTASFPLLSSSLLLLMAGVWAIEDTLPQQLFSCLLVFFVYG